MQTSIQAVCVALSIIFTGVLCIPESTYAATLAKPANNLGLVGYWSFDDASGTVATDFSGNGNTGTLTNVAAPATATSGWGSGKLGGGINFDGTNDYVTIPNTTAMDSTSLSVCAWVKPAGFSNYQNIFAKTGSDNFEQIGLLVNGSGQVSFQLGSSGTFAGSLTLNAWNFVCGSANASTGTLYINGASIASSANSGHYYSVTPLTIGVTYYAGFSRYFNGSIDDVRVYNRTLSATEIISLYNAGAQKLNVPRNKTGTSLDSGLVGLWSFDGKDISGTTAFDRSGSGNNGTLTNGATTTTGKFGQAARFDGVNDYSGAQYDLARTSSTISVWIKTTVKDQGISQWSSAGYTYNGFTDRVLTLNSSGQARLYVYNGGACSAATLYIAGGADLSDNNWHHIVGVWGPSGKYLYVDGALVANNTDGIQSSTGSMPYLTIGEGDPGCSNSPARQYFNGSIDDVRVYNRSLSSTEINKLYTFGVQTVNASRNTTGGSLDSGLVGLWSFDGKDLNGTTAYDRSGSGNNGTLTNGPLPAIGKMGQGLKFDGTDDLVSIPSSSSFAFGTGEFSIAAWIKTTATPLSCWTSFVSIGGGYSAANSINLYAPGTGAVPTGSVAVILNAVNPTMRSTTLVNDGLWHHIIVTRNSGGAKLYVDKVLEDSAATSINVPASSMRIGSDQSCGTYLNGSVDDVRVYNRALSSAEAQNLYNLGK